MRGKLDSKIKFSGNPVQEIIRFPHGVPIALISGIGFSQIQLAAQAPNTGPCLSWQPCHKASPALFLSKLNT